MVPVFLIVFFGLVTMSSFVGENPFFNKQLVWLVVSTLAFCICSVIDFKFLRRTNVVVWLYVITVVLLLILSSIGAVFSGAQSWFNFGAFAFQPAELAML